MYEADTEDLLSQFARSSGDPAGVGSSVVLLLGSHLAC